MPIRLAPIAWAVVGALALVGAFMVIDALLDRARMQVHAKYATAAKIKNDEIGTFNSEDELASAVMEKALARAQAQAELVKGQCPATQEQAAALTAIRRAQQQ